MAFTLRFAVNGIVTQIQTNQGHVSLPMCDCERVHREKSCFYDA